MDNLFTSVKLLTRLRELGIGGVGTVRTTKTERERRGGGEGNIVVNKKAGGRRKFKLPTEQIDERLADLKLTYAA